MQDYGVNVAGTPVPPPTRTRRRQLRQRRPALLTHDVELDNAFCNSVTRTGSCSTSSARRTCATSPSRTSSTGQGSYFARGEADKTKPNGDEGPLRFEHVTYSARPCDGCAVGAIKLYRHWTGIEVLDSVFNADTAAYGKRAYNRLPVRDRRLVQHRGWTIRNDAFTDWAEAIHVEPVIDDPGYCYY
ncbi:MAG: hypothetical protein U0802_22700 [Candidatus Binatia bacterium]